LANDVKSIYLPGSDIVVPTASKFPILYDSDGDGVADDWDNCPDVYNPGQENTDGDEKGDLCEDEI
jgi:hypothetical protein